MHVVLENDRKITISSKILSREPDSILTESLLHRLVNIYLGISMYIGEPKPKLMMEVMYHFIEMLIWSNDKGNMWLKTELERVLTSRSEVVEISNQPRIPEVPTPQLVQTIWACLDLVPLLEEHAHTESRVSYFKLFKLFRVVVHTDVTQHPGSKKLPPYFGVRSTSDGTLFALSKGSPTMTTLTWDQLREIAHRELIPQPRIAELIEISNEKYGRKKTLTKVSE